MITVTLDVDEKVMAEIADEARRAARSPDDVMRERLSSASRRSAVPSRDPSELAERLRRIDAVHDQLQANGVMIDPEQLRRDIREGRP